MKSENDRMSVFPAELTAEMLKDFVQTRNGSTCPHHGRIDGVHYIAKCARYSEGVTATSDEHVHNEYLADCFLRAAGFSVPESREYRVDFHDGKGLRVVRLARFLEDARPLAEVILRMGAHIEGWLIDQVVLAYPVQSFVGGIDTFQNDNVLVDSEGCLWFVDNGASFDFRAQGARKCPSWFDRKDPEDPNCGYLSLLKHRSQRQLQVLLSESLALDVARKFDFLSLAMKLSEELKKSSVIKYAQILNAWAMESQNKEVAGAENGALGVRVVKGDVAATVADAVVNAANEHLRAGSGICGVIFKRAGLAQLQAACDNVAPCPTGEARVTPAFGITNAKFIIHAVGLRYVDGRHGEPEKLASCYRNLLSAAVENGCKSVAVPSISTGVFGYPLKDAATIAIRETRAFLATHPDLEVIFVAWDDTTKDLYECLLSKGRN